MPKALPKLGDWPDRIHGELGVLAADGDKLRCHACGGWYRSLAIHAFCAHGLTAAEYRAIFGLRAGHSLIGPALQARQREVAAATLGRLGARFSGVARLSFEERSTLMRGRRLRLESRLDPANRAAYERRTQRLRQRVAAGELPRPGTYPRTERHRHPPETRAKIGAAHRGRVHHYGNQRQIAAALAALDGQRITVLPEPERIALVLRYGLGAEGRPRTYAELTQALGLSRKVLARLVRQAVACLLSFA